MPEAHPLPAPNPSTGVAAVIGGATLLTVAANLGFPGLMQPVASAVLLTAAGYCLARAVFRNTSAERWKPALVLSLAGRAWPALLLTVTLTGLYALITDGGLARSESLALLAAVTFTSNLVPLLTDASFAPVNHLGLVALLAQAALLAPFLLTAGAHRIDRRTRALLMIGAAAVIATARIGITAVDLAPGTDFSWLAFDSLLVGMAVGTMPLASLHRHPTTRLVLPSIGVLAVLLAAPELGGPAVSIGVRPAVATVLTSAILAAAAIFSLPRITNPLFSSIWLHRIATRAYGLFLWHIPFAYALGGGDPFRWQGPVVFSVTLLLSLAAATVSYRSIELPALVTLRWCVRNWFSADVIVLSTPAPQGDKWRRWDDVSLDGLPLVSRRQTPSASADRLWQHGDRSQHFA